MEGHYGKKIAVITIVIIAAIFGYIIFNTFFIAKDYLYGPPLLFMKNRYISVDIYPHGYSSATVFTNNYIEGTTTPEDIDILRLFLKKKDIKGVFFVIPNYIKTHSLSKSPLVVAELAKLREDGHEIAQAGTYHTYGPDMARGAEPGQELLTLSFDAQIERVRKGRDRLVALGFPPVGFRAPNFSTNEETFRVLESLDYLYDSSSMAPPRTFNTLLKPSLSQGILYPYHPTGYEFLEFTDFVDPTRRYGKAVSLFKRVTEQNGVFVYHTFIGNITKPERLQLLNTFLDFIRNENTWCCTLTELTEWWQAREKMRVDIEKDGKVFRITFNNKTPFPMPEFGLELRMAPSGVSQYLILDSLGNKLAFGDLPLQKKIFISLVGNPES